MAQETVTPQPMPEMASMESPSVVDRVRDSIADAFDRFTHPVSREAEAQLQTITAQLEGTPVARTLDQIQPHLRELLTNADANAMVMGIMARVLLLGAGAALVHGGVRGQGRRLLERGVYGLLGGASIVLGLQGNIEGFPARQVIQARTGRLLMFYDTDTGRADAVNPGRTSAQVDSIVRAITAGYVPSVSRP